MNPVGSTFTLDDNQKLSQLLDPKQTTSGQQTAQSMIQALNEDNHPRTLKEKFLLHSEISGTKGQNSTYHMAISSDLSLTGLGLLKTTNNGEVSRKWKLSVTGFTREKTGRFPKSVIAMRLNCKPVECLHELSAAGEDESTFMVTGTTENEKLWEKTVSHVGTVPIKSNVLGCFNGRIYMDADEGLLQIYVDCGLSSGVDRYSSPDAFRMIGSPCEYYMHRCLRPSLRPMTLTHAAFGFMRPSGTLQHTPPTTCRNPRSPLTSHTSRTPRSTSYSSYTFPVVEG